MSGTTWSKFYWNDWLSDPALRRSSFAARGLWFDLLCIAAQHDPIGYIAVNNEALLANDIARMVGGSESEVSTLLQELDRNGVLSRNRNGLLFSRRMIRDDKKRRTAQQNGKMGGNPTLLNHNGNYPLDKGRLKTHLPDTSNQKERKQDAASSKYFFESGVIKLTEDNFNLWKSAFSYLDLAAELVAMTGWANQQTHWFSAVSNALNKKNRALKDQKEGARAPNVFHWRSGIEGVV